MESSNTNVLDSSGPHVQGEGRTWLTPDEYRQKYAKEGITLRLPIYIDCASIHNYLSRTTDLKNISAYTLGAITTDVEDFLGIRVACTDNCPDGEDALIGEKRIYDYCGAPLQVNMWYPASTARRMWAAA